LKSLVVEARHENLGPVTTGYEDISLKRITVISGAVVHIDVRDVDSSVRINPLPVLEAEHGAFVSFYRELRNSRNVPAKIKYPCRIIDLVDTFRRNPFYIPYRMQLL